MRKVHAADASLLARVASHLSSVQALSDHLDSLESQVGEAESRRRDERNGRSCDKLEAGYSSSSSSSSSGDEKPKKPLSRQLPSAQIPLLSSNQPYNVEETFLSMATLPAPKTGVVQTTSSSLPVRTRSKPIDIWRGKVKEIQKMHRGKNFMLSQFKEVKKSRGRTALTFLVLVVALSAAETLTKSATFHISAVGLYSIDGEPYQFKYSIFLTCCVFFVKLGLGPLHKFLKDKKHHKRKSTPRGKGCCDLVMPWLLLIGFTALEMLSVALGNYGLTRTPTSIYVVCKTSKILFVAIMSVVMLGARLAIPQWISLLILSLALLLACFAEGGSSGKAGNAGFSLIGPLILICGELVHAGMLVSQQIAVEKYWPDPMALVSWSAAVGIPMTLTTMVAASHAREPASPHEPINDTTDVFVMCFNNPALGIALASNLVFHVAMDVSHILCLKYMDSLTRSLADAAKFTLMWVLGKLFWFSGEAIFRSSWPAGGGVLTVVAEPWKPHSWLMIPVIIIIAYALLVYKSAAFVPIEMVTGDDGKEKWALKAPEEGRIVETSIIESFYVDAYHNKKIQRHMHRAIRLFQQKRRISEPRNLWQRRVDVKAVIRWGREMGRRDS